MAKKTVSETNSWQINGLNYKWINIHRVFIEHKQRPRKWNRHRKRKWIVYGSMYYLEFFLCHLMNDNRYKSRWQKNAKKKTNLVGIRLKPFNWVCILHFNSLCGAIRLFTHSFTHSLPSNNSVAWWYAVWTQWLKTQKSIIKQVKWNRNQNQFFSRFTYDILDRLN